jgi:hypothetical protein
MSQLKLLELPSADTKVANGTPMQVARSARVAPRRLWVQDRPMEACPW